MKTANEILENVSKQKKSTSINILSKDFAPNESSIAKIKLSDLKNSLAILSIKNNNEQIAQFSWQKNVLSSTTETGYFKEMTNDLGVVVHHNEDSITVINGGVKQFLTIHINI